LPLGLASNPARAVAAPPPPPPRTHLPLAPASQEPARVARIRPRKMAQGCVISLSIRGWHPSRNLRTFLARLMAVPFSSSELGLRATAHIISYPALLAVSTRAWGVLKMLFAVYHAGPAAPTGPWRGVPTAVLSKRAICSGYVKLPH
jgi:hypothetical protein